MTSPQRYGDGGAAAALVTAVADAYAALERGEAVSRADTWEEQIEQNSLPFLKLT